MAGSPGMESWRARAGWGLAAGALSGLLALGLAGRLAMSVLAVMAGNPVRWSLGGTLDVLAFAALVGAPAGAVYGLLRDLGPPRWWRGAAYGLALFALFVLVPPPAARSAFSGVRALWLPVLALFGAAFTAYGATLEWLLRWRAASGQDRGQRDLAQDPQAPGHEDAPHRR
jgi:hypothetical protein